jgi:alkylation response protein AidB-like acyl-CoA dehydrogenase
MNPDKLSFVLTEDQEAIRKTVREFVHRQAPVSQLRSLRDSKDKRGYDVGVWEQLSEMGFASAFLPEPYGLGLGFAELGLVAEELGRNLVASPLLATSVLGASALLLGASDVCKQELLTDVASGQHLLGWAHDEGRHHQRYSIHTSAKNIAKDTWELSGNKSWVLDGHIASSLIVSSRTSGDSGDRDGITMWVVPTSSAGLTVERTWMVDSRNAATAQLAGAKVGAHQMLGKLGEGADLLDQLLDRGAVVLSAEMLGGALQVFELTLAYLKERKQFGVPIGSFQALKHRAVHLFCELELSKSVVMAALRALDANTPDWPKLACAAKARLSDTFAAVANEAVQMHGGVGVTDEFDIGFYLKRAKVTEQCFGSSAFHRNRFAQMEGY